MPDTPEIQTFMDRLPDSQADVSAAAQALLEAAEAAYRVLNQGRRGLSTRERVASERLKSAIDRAKALR